MEAAAHTPGGFGDVPQSVGREFINADKRPHHAHGGIPGFADGGYSPPAPTFGAREAMREEMSPTAGGIIQSEIPGRTDHIPLSPAAGSYVIPADVMSGIGEGNSLAGARLMDEILHSGPYGIAMGGGRSTNRFPSPPRPSAMARGGEAKNPLRTMDASDKRAPGTVPIMAAGGEYVLGPDIVKNHPLLGNGDLKRGHKILDAWILHERKKHIKTLSKLPGPAR